MISWELHNLFLDCETGDIWSEDKDDKGFVNKSFICRSGHAPENHAGCEEIYRNDAEKGGKLVIRCRDTGGKTKADKIIWETKSGTRFICRYWPGDAGHVDRAVLVSI